MKLILAQYLRTLKERDEFDRLLPDLLLAMGYVPISLPQTGVRQYGVDLAAVGISPDDGIQELLMLVIKRGDIGRTEWDSGPQSVRQSLNEVFEVYLRTLVEPAHESLRKRIVLATTGELKQDTQINWDGYTKDNSDRAYFGFWGGAQTSVLIEKYMLDEHIFDSEDRTHLRKSLALAGELDYDQKDLHRLFRRQLGIGDAGELLQQPAHPRHLEKALRIVNLAAQIFAKWSEDEGNLKQALIASERALLWSWHRIQLEEVDKRKQYHSEISEMWRTYNAVSYRYFEKLREHMYVPDGLSGYCRENAEFSLVVFEQIGIISTIGLCQVLMFSDNEAQQQDNLESAIVVADTLASLIKNNPVSASPRLDGNVIDIVLGLLLLVLTGHVSQAQDWLSELVRRADYTFKAKRNFPISTDSIDDLIEVTVFGDEELRTRLIKMSWLLPTLAGWAVLLGRGDLYEAIAKNSKNEYPEVCLQLWHPTQGLAKHLYYWPAQYHCGESEAPITLPDRSSEFRDMMKAVLDSKRHNIFDNSSAGLAGIVALDLIACRHHRTPVAPYFWYRLLETLPKGGASVIE
ncbi:MAG: hypothetical protein WCI39_12895 [Gallionellaceae bacterium]